MRKLVIEGWGGKAGRWHYLKGAGKQVVLLVYTDRGRRVEWADEDWPPVRVRMTIEEIAVGAEAQDKKRAKGGRKGRKKVVKKKG